LASRTDFSKNALHSTLQRSANEDSLRLEQSKQMLRDVMYGCYTGMLSMLGGWHGVPDVVMVFCDETTLLDKNVAESVWISDVTGWTVRRA